MTSDKSGRHVEIAQKRSRSGCLTCKIRKIKCDEGKPHCHRCLSTGRKCDGYPEPPNRSVSSALLIVPVVQTFGNQEEFSAFNRFTALASTLTNFAGEGLWSSLALQICHAESSIKNLVIAIGHLDQCVDMPNARPLYGRQRAKYLQHYGRALSILGTHSRLDLNIVLIACLLLGLCEDLQQKSYSALQHFTAGRKILLQNRSGSCLGSTEGVRATDPLNIALVAVFRQLEEHIGIYDRETIPIHLRLPLRGFEGMEAGLKMQRRIVDRLGMTQKQQDDFGYPCDLLSLTPNKLATLQFLSIPHAGQCLRSLIGSSLAPLPNKSGPSSIFQPASPVTKPLNRWLEVFNAYMAAQTSKVDMQTLIDIHILRTYHQVLGIASRTVPFGREVLFDAYLDIFEHVLFKLALFVAVADVEITPMLFFLATRARDSVVRCRAITMLQQCDHEGKSLAVIAEHVMRLEESGLPSDSAGNDTIPEASRVRVMFVQAFPAQQRAALYFARFPYFHPTPVESDWVDFSHLEEADWCSRIAGRLDRALRLQMFPAS